MYENVQEEIDDILYTTLFSVEVGSQNRPTKVELAYVMDFNTESLLSDYLPSETFIEEAIKKISNLEWECALDEHGNPNEQTAYCYVLKSDPDNPACSNNMER